jgi:hypothetical protein
MDVNSFKHLQCKSPIRTDIIVLEIDFEAAIKKDLVNKGYDGLYEALEGEAIKLIKPVGNQQKGAIARHVAREIQTQVGDYAPEFVNVLAKLINEKISLS